MVPPDRAGVSLVQKMTMLSKSGFDSFFSAEDSVEGAGAGFSCSRKIRHVGKTLRMVLMITAGGGREKSPA